MNNTDKNKKTRGIINLKWALFTLGMLITIVIGISSLNNSRGGKDVPVSVLIENANRNNVEKVYFSTDSKNSNELRFTLKDSRKVYSTNTPYNLGLLQYLQNLNITNIDSEQALKTTNPLMIIFKTFANILMLVSNLLSILGPIILFGAIYFMFFRRKSSSSSFPFDFEEKQYDPVDTKNQIKLDDIAGMTSVKEEVSEIINYLVQPEAFKKIGAIMPKGILLCGPPGVGKTLLARAVAGEAGVPFLFVCASELSTPIVSVGSMIVKRLFKKAQSFKSPCIIFIDEIDSIGRKRTVGGNQINDLELTLNTLLDELDGFKGKNNIIVMGATNLYESLDSALTRPGRFDRKIFLNLPTASERKEILELYIKKVSAADNIDISLLAQLTPEYSGASLALLINEAAILAVQSKKEYVSNSDLMEIWQRLALGGRLNKGFTLSEKNKEIIAYHESGHALVGHHHDVFVNIVSVTPRGASLGVTVFIPDEQESILVSKNRFEKRIQVLLAGRAAEEIIYGQENVHAGAVDDIFRATKIAKDMVIKYGFSESIGLINYINVDYIEKASDTTTALIDQEVQAILAKAYNNAKSIINSKLDMLHKLSNFLVKNDIINREQFTHLLNHEEVGTASDN